MKAKSQILGILILGIPLFFLACRKDREVAKYEGDYTITGKVVDEITGKGIHQANVGVIERDRDATSHLGGKTVAFDKSDAEGNFTLTFSVNSEVNNYELTANALTYFTKTSGDNITFTKNGSRTQNVSLMPHSYLTLQINGNKGGMKLNVNGGGGPYYQGVDTSITVYAIVNQNISFAYWVSYLDTSLNYKTIVDLPPPSPHDTTYYLIEF